MPLDLLFGTSVVGMELEPYGSGNGRNHVLNRADACQRDEVDAVAMAFEPARCGLLHQSGLADSARAQNSDQADCRIVEEAIQLFQFCLTTDEASRLRREVVPDRRRCLLTTYRTSRG